MSAWRNKFLADIKKAPEPFKDRIPFAPRNTRQIFRMVKYNGIREYVAKTTGNVIQMMTFVVQSNKDMKQYTMWLPNFVAKKFVEELQSDGFMIRFDEGETSLVRAWEPRVEDEE